MGAFGIPAEDWTLAKRLGLRYSIIHSGVYDMAFETRIGEYFFDDLEAPTRPSRDELENMARAVSNLGLEPWTSAVPSFLGRQAAQLRHWNDADIFFGFQNYRYNPVLWSIFDGFFQRILTGFYMRGRRWFGVVDAVYPVYSPSYSWKPMNPKVIRGQIRKYKKVGAAVLMFYPWHAEAMTAALGQELHD